jgi:phage-related baseplate assembly protein
MHVRRTLTGVGVLVLTLGTARAQHSQMPAGMTHEQHQAQMKKDADLKKRGAEAMGFDQEKATHHFRLSASGGVIDVNVNDPADSASRAQIRSHLEQIAREFRQGVFDKPFATHAERPPGVEVMARLKAAITYTVEETPTGAIVRIRTSRDEGRRAVHDFLRYQIKEHATGDSLAVSK